MIKGKGIILVDDVITTGATLSECARMLKQAGAEKILGMTIAVVTD
jgi:competence protein ComFC